MKPFGFFVVSIVGVFALIWAQSVSVVHTYRLTQFVIAVYKHKLWKTQVLAVHFQTIRIQQEVKIQKIGYNKWNATQWAIHATELGQPLEEYPQTMGNFNRPTKEMERLILSSDVVINNNEITRWRFRNVELKSDHNGNVKPNKSLRSKKIDGAIAMIQALGTHLYSTPL